MVHILRRKNFPTSKLVHRCINLWMGDHVCNHCMKWWTALAAIFLRTTMVDGYRDAAGKPCEVIRGSQNMETGVLRSHKRLISMFTVSNVELNWLVNTWHLFPHCGITAHSLHQWIKFGVSYQGCTADRIVGHSLGLNPDQNICHSTPHRPLNELA